MKTILAKLAIIAVGLAVGVTYIVTTVKAVTMVKWDVPHVQISLIKEISSNPHTYTLVRVLASSTPNLGTFKWSKLPSDKGTNLYVEVECLRSTQACAAVSPIGPFTVK